MTTISFVVPVRNDAARLNVCLKSIERERAGDVSIEVVVVDNGSTDASKEVARRHGATVLEIRQGRVSFLRNEGARATRGQILAFVDADNEISPGWVAAAIENLQGRTGAAGALYLAPTRGTWVQRAYGVLRGRSHRREDTQWLGSGNVAVGRQAFEAIGGFDVRLEACEDVDFCLRLRNAGFRLVADPRMESTHHGDPPTLLALFTSERWRGRDNLRVSLRRPIVWSGVPSALVSVLDLAMLATALVGIVAGAAGWHAGISVAIAALLIVLAGAALRAALVLRREPDGDAGLLPLLAVTLTYNVARALATVTRAPHRNAPDAAASVS